MGATYVVSTDFVARDLYTQRLRGMEGATRHFASSAKRDIRSVGDVFRGSFLGTAGANLMASGLSRITSAMGNAVTNYVKFDAALGKAALRFPEGAQRGSKAFAALERGARDLGRTGEATSEQAAQGYQVLAAAGFDVQQSVGALNPILHLSEATNTDFAIAANVAAKSLKAFKLGTDQMTRVSDVYAATNAKTGATVEDLYSAVESGGNAFATSGQSLETYLAIVGNLSTRGIPATRSAMALSQAMLRLSGGSKPASKELKKIGIATTEIGKDGKQHVRGFVDIIGDLNKKLEGKGLTQKQGIIAQIFGAKAMKNLMPLFDGGTDAIKKLQAELENATGTAAKMDEELDKGIGDQIERIKGALSERGLDIVGGIFGGGSNIDGIIASINKFDVGPIVSGAKALGSAFGFLAEHADAVASIAASMLIIKGALMLSGGVKAGVGMIGALGSMGGIAPGLAGAATGWGVSGGGISAQREAELDRNFKRNVNIGGQTMRFTFADEMVKQPGKFRQVGGVIADGFKSGAALQAAGIGVAIGMAATAAMKSAAEETTSRQNKDEKSYDAARRKAASGDIAGAKKYLKSRKEYEVDRAFGGISEGIGTGAAILGAAFTGGASPIDEFRQNAKRRKLLETEIATSEANQSSKSAEMMMNLHESFKVEIELTGDGADKAKIGPVKTKSGKGGPSAPSVNRSKTGSQR
jgi:TP901 family phage tail tape measure protein